MQIQKRITVTIKGSELLKLLISTFASRGYESTGKERVLFYALGYLPGISDVEAVKKTNKKADDHMLPRIKVAEFRRWLPKLLSEIFAEYMEGETIA